MSGIEHSQGEPIVSDALSERAVIDAVGRAVIVTRPDGEIVLWNQAAYELSTSSVQHGGGRGTLRIWIDGDDVVCEVRDEGRIADRCSVGSGRPPMAPVVAVCGSRTNCATSSNSVRSRGRP